MLARHLQFVVAAVLFVSCGERIPPEAPALSEELGASIDTIRDSHVNAIRQVFALKRDEVNRYYREVWLPAFAQNFFASDGIRPAREWVTHCPAMSSAERVEQEAKANRRINCDEEMLQFVVRSGPALQAELERQRASIIAPLDELERTLLVKIDDKYTEARAINTAITAFLTSASEVTQTRDKYLKKVGITDEKIDDAVNKVDELVSNFLIKAKGLEEKAEATKEFLERAKALTDEIETGT